MTLLTQDMDAAWHSSFSSVVTVMGHFWILTFGTWFLLVKKSVGQNLMFHLACVMQGIQ